MSVAPGSTDASMADAAGTAEDAPPDKLDEAEHDAWKRCVALGGRDQFKLPDDELNARRTPAQRGTITGGTAAATTTRFWLASRRKLNWQSPRCSTRTTRRT